MPNSMKPVEGRTYRFIYRQGKKQMAVTGVYLGYSKAMGGNHMLSLRPKGGTITLRREDIVGCAAAAPGVVALPHSWETF